MYASGGRVDVRPQVCLRESEVLEEMIKQGLEACKELRLGRSK